MERLMKVIRAPWMATAVLLVFVVGLVFLALFTDALPYFGTDYSMRQND
jgi:hypothetical protein